MNVVGAAKDIIRDSFLGQVAFAEGVFTGSLDLLEQGLPFKEQLKDAYELVQSPRAYIEKATSRPNPFAGLKDSLIHRATAFIAASPFERAKAIGEMAPGLALAVLAPELEGVQGATTPYGMGSVRSFQKASRMIYEAAQDEEALVGMRGSAATGIRFRGGKFCDKSDFDYFVVSDKVFQEGVKRGVKPRKGAFYVWHTEKASPEIFAIEERLKGRLVRKSKIRIFSHEGFNRFFKTGKEIISR